LKKRYVRRQDVEDVKARCEANRQELRDINAAWAAWREMRATLREVEAAICTT
jgi:hypothetical protein